MNLPRLPPAFAEEVLDIELLLERSLSAPSISRLIELYTVN
jgi:hypothetical protein